MSLINHLRSRGLGKEHICHFTLLCVCKRKWRNGCIRVHTYPVQIYIGSTKADRGNEAPEGTQGILVSFSFFPHFFYASNNIPPTRDSDFRWTV